MGAATDWILLHGALGASAQLAPLAQAFPRNERMRVLDFEGHANGAPTERPFRMEHFAENVLVFMDENHIHRAHFFGYSMGGYVAMLFASQHPDRVHTVATLGTKYHWDVDVAEREAGRLNPEVIRAKVPQFAAALEARHADVGGWERVLAKTVDLLHELGRHPRLTDNVLQSIEARVLVMVGDRDNTVSAADGESVAQQLARGTFRQLENTPHPIEQVDVASLASVLQTQE